MERKFSECLECGLGRLWGNKTFIDTYSLIDLDVIQKIKGQFGAQILWLAVSCIPSECFPAPSIDVKCLNLLMLSVSRCVWVIPHELLDVLKYDIAIIRVVYLPRSSYIVLIWWTCCDRAACFRRSQSLVQSLLLCYSLERLLAQN